MTDSIDSLDDLDGLDEDELWKIAGDDEHPHQLAAQALLRNSAPDSEQNGRDDTEPEDSHGQDQGVEEDSGTPLDELCERIINREETPETLRDVCRGVKQGVEAGEIDR